MSLAMSQAGTTTDNGYSMHFVGLLSPRFLLSSMPERVYQLSKETDPNPLERRWREELWRIAV
jgi:hypothetical protein